MTFCLPVAYYREHLQRKEREDKGLAEPLLVRPWLFRAPFLLGQTERGR